MKLMRCMAKVRAWTPEIRAGSGVVVSRRYGNVCVQRGVQLRSEDDATDDADHAGTGAGESVSGGNRPAICWRKCLPNARWQSSGTQRTATGQISGTAGMDALPECVWQQGVQ